MTTTVILALGTNDDADSASVTEKNVTDIIDSLLTRGYRTFVLVPPNPDDTLDEFVDYKTQHDAVAAAEFYQIGPFQYNSVAGSGVSPLGKNATFNVTASNKVYTNVSVESDGTGYLKNEIITISGSQVGGESPDNDVTVIVTEVGTLGNILAVSFVGVAAGEIILEDVEGMYSVPEPRHLTKESCVELRNKYPKALCVGDHNAVRINGFKSTEVAKKESTTGDTLKRVEYRMPEPTDGVKETGSLAITITEQDKTLLDMISKTNLAGNTYTSHYLNQKEPRLTEWTLEQVRLFQSRLLRRSRKLGESSAVGKYQLIKSSLALAYNYLDLDPKLIRFTEEIQDALIIARLEQVRKYKEWKSGKFPDEDFCIQLAMEFDSVPVPRAIRAGEVRAGVPANDLLAGQSFYTGDLIFTEGHNIKAFMQSLSDLRKAGPGKVYKIDVTPGGKNAASPPSGKTYRRTAEVSAAGGNRISGGRRVNANPNAKINLPSSGDVYTYNSLDPYDDRYDFRTGKQVRDVGVNQTKSVLENPSYTVKGNDPLQDAGSAPEYEPVTETKINETVDVVDYETQETINPTQEQKLNNAKDIVKQLKIQGITDKREQANILAVVENTSLLDYRSMTRDDSTGVYKNRGYVQLKGQSNYQKVGDSIGVDLVNNPELLNDPDIGAKAAASFYKNQSSSINIKNTRNLYSVTNGFDPYLTTDPALRIKGQKDIKSIDALSDSWFDELDRIDPEQKVTTTTSAVELLDGGLQGVTDKPLPTGRSLPSPRNPFEITSSIQDEIDSISDSAYNEKLAEDYLGVSNGKIIDKTTGIEIGVQPLNSEIKYDAKGNIVLDKPNWRFMSNGSGAIELDV